MRFIYDFLDVPPEGGPWVLLGALFALWAFLALLFLWGDGLTSALLPIGAALCIRVTAELR